jgi:hypothetical protein
MNKVPARHLFGSRKKSGHIAAVAYKFVQSIQDPKLLTREPSEA